MLSRIQPLGSCLIVLALLLFAGSAGAQDVSPRCEAAIDRAAGHYSQCLLSADASYARHENATKLANRQTRCETRFDRRAARAIRHHGADECPSSHLVADIEDRTTSYAEGVAREARGQAAADSFFVLQSEGGTLTESTLTLTDVSRRTGWFAWSGHAHEAGELSTTDFVEALQNARDDAEASASPLIVDFTMEQGEEVFRYDLELSDPVYDEESDTLSYTVLEATPDKGEGAVCNWCGKRSKSVEETIQFEHSQLATTTLADRTVSYAEGVSIEAGGEAAASLLYVQTAAGATLSGTTLTLTNQYTRRLESVHGAPYREAGQFGTEEFIALWDEGETFAEDPPTADFTCSVDGEVVNYVVELTSPSIIPSLPWAAGGLSYSVSAVGGTVLPETPIACQVQSWGYENCRWRGPLLAPARYTEPLLQVRTDRRTGPVPLSRAF